MPKGLPSENPWVLVRNLRGCAIIRRDSGLAPTASRRITRRMTWSAGWGLFAVMVVLAAVPSTSVALVVTRAVTGGVRNGVAAALGIVTGDLGFVLLAVLGMSAVAEATGALFAVFKYVGGAYLLWLGWQVLRARPGKWMLPTPAPVGSLGASWLAGLVITLGDVKAILFYASLFPALVDLATLSTAQVGVILAITAVTVGGVKIAYAWLARRIVARLQQPRWRRAGQLSLGSVMLGAGGYLIAKV